jgi:hypothetical protein
VCLLAKNEHERRRVWEREERDGAFVADSLLEVNPVLSLSSILAQDIVLGVAVHGSLARGVVQRPLRVVHSRVVLHLLRVTVSRQSAISPIGTAAACVGRAVWPTLVLGVVAPQAKELASIL